MGDASSLASADHPARRGWLAAVPFALAWMVAAAVLNAPLGPPGLNPEGRGPQIDQAPTQELPSPPATHHEHQDDVFDSAELISV